MAPWPDATELELDGQAPAWAKRSSYCYAYVLGICTVAGRVPETTAAAGGTGIRIRLIIHTLDLKGILAQSIFEFYVQNW